MTNFSPPPFLSPSSLLRSAGRSLDSAGARLERSKYSERLVPSSRLVAFPSGEGDSDNSDTSSSTPAEKAGLPSLHPTAFVSPSASVIGPAVLGPHTSVWYSAVVRCDVNSLSVGSGSSIGDGAAGGGKAPKKKAKKMPKTQRIKNVQR